MRIVATTPLIAIATRARHCTRDGRQTQYINVLPVWNDGTSVLLDLSWHDGDSCEDCGSPEWHLRASSGMPAERGLAELCECSKMFPDGRGCKYHMYVVPSLLGTHVLPESVEEWTGQPWRHQWTFESCDELEAAVRRLTEQVAEVAIFA